MRFNQAAARESALLRGMVKPTMFVLLWRNAPGRSFADGTLCQSTHPEFAGYALKLLVTMFAAVYAMTFIATPSLGAGWFWDIGNGIGFAAFGGLLFLTVSSGRPLNVRSHQRTGYILLFIAMAHAFWFLLGDAALSQYLKPGAPGYMWLGLFSLALLAAMITVALPTDRQRLYPDHSKFHYWHRLMAKSTIAAATYHILASGFYLNNGYQKALFAGLALFALIGRPALTRLFHPAATSPFSVLLLCIVMTLLFAAARNAPL
ncbi:hypothetical protein [Parahaliea mediterranea]|uniref:Ferric oxidoreductase domain-containing protein n=1 Tax=Parahaliea mediterranea TaxID=651086 RepID=A0A939IHD5_9GAMM|nr:hypothetical protein [Parahaliea mediterranea]MBN7795299.1 hypothetical protein [Parahaliea mediterranea]